VRSADCPFAVTLGLSPLDARKVSFGRPLRLTRWWSVGVQFVARRRHLFERARPSRDLHGSGSKTNSCESVSHFPTPVSDAAVRAGSLALSRASSAFWSIATAKAVSASTAPLQRMVSSDALPLL
jgi:hypothetical protein